MAGQANPDKDRRDNRAALHQDHQDSLDLDVGQAADVVDLAVRNHADPVAAGQHRGEAMDKVAATTAASNHAIA